MLKHKTTTLNTSPVKRLFNKMLGDFVNKFKGSFEEFVELYNLIAIDALASEPAAFNEITNPETLLLIARKANSGYLSDILEFHKLPLNIVLKRDPHHWRLLSESEKNDNFALICVKGAPEIWDDSGFEKYRNNITAAWALSKKPETFFYESFSAYRSPKNAKYVKQTLKYADIQRLENITKIFINNFI